MFELITPFLRLSTATVWRNSFRQLVSVTSFFQSLPRAHDHRWGLERRLTGKSKTLPFGSAPESQSFCTEKEVSVESNVSCDACIAFTAFTKDNQGNITSLQVLLNPQFWEYPPSVHLYATDKYYVHQFIPIRYFVIFGLQLSLFPFMLLQTQVSVRPTDAGGML